MRSHKKISYKKIRAYKYQLKADYCLTFSTPISLEIPVELGRYFRVTRFGLEVFRGYSWDGLSGPTIDTKESFIAGLVHDVLYQAIREELLPLSFKPFADELFYELLKRDSENRIYSFVLYHGVTIFGGPSCVPGTVIVSNETLTAP